MTTGLPILAISPLLGLLLNMQPDAYLSLLAGMALGTPVLSLVGAVGAAWCSARAAPASWYRCWCCR